MKKMITDIMLGIRKNPNKFVRRFSVSLLTVNICSLLYSLSCFFKVVKWVNDDNMTRFFTGELPVQINGYLNGSSQGFTVFLVTMIALLMTLWSFMWRHTDIQREWVDDKC